MVRICETLEALDRVQNSHRHLLKALNSERPELYAALGRAISGRRIDLSSRGAPAPALKQARRRRGAAVATVETIDA